MKFKVRTEYNVGTDGTDIAVMRENYDGSRDFLQPLVFKSYPKFTAIPREEAFCVSSQFGRDDAKPFLQAMMDAAFELGMTPTKAKDHTDELKAVRYHLEDMRSLALKKSR